MRATIKIFVSGIFLKKTKKLFQNLKQSYFRFENTFVSQYFINKNIFALKKMYFCFRNTFTFVSETLRKTNRKKSPSVLWSWPMRATRR